MPSLASCSYITLCVLSFFMLINTIHLFIYFFKTNEERAKYQEWQFANNPPIVRFSTFDGSPWVALYDRYVHHFPTLMYGLHILPALLWSITCPLQFSSSLRSSYPSIHRWCGRIFLLCSISLGISGLLVTLCGYALSIGVPTSIQEFFSTLITVIPILAALFLYYGYQAWVAIRQGAVIRHRSCIVRHVCLGCSVHVMRLVIIIRTIIEKYPEWEQQTPKEWEYQQRLFFGSSLWIGVVICAMLGELGVRVMGWEPWTLTSPPTKRTTTSNGTTSASTSTSITNGHNGKKQE